MFVLSGGKPRIGPVATTMGTGRGSCFRAENPLGLTGGTLFETFGGCFRTANHSKTA